MDENEVHHIAIEQTVVQVSQGASQDEPVDQAHPPLRQRQPRQFPDHIGTKAEAQNDEKPALPATCISQK